jgi:membrane protease YdiL (CAAX protease family)
MIAPDAVKADLLSSVSSVFFQLTFGLLVGAVVLIIFLSAIGWWRDLFARQPIGGSRWMWIAVIIIVTPIVLRLFGIDYSRYPSGVVATVFATGVLIGFAEEVLTRGIAVKMLRDAGHPEWVVAAVSSVLFALMHSINLFSGAAPLVVAITVFYALGFGVLMYLSMRVSGFLIVAIVLHSLTDPTTILATGGLDEAASDAAQNALLTAASPFNFVIMFAGLIMLIFIRGRVPGRQQASEPAA